MHSNFDFHFQSEEIENVLQVPPQEEAVVKSPRRSPRIKKVISTNSDSDIFTPPKLGGG